MLISGSGHFVDKHLVHSQVGVLVGFLYLLLLQQAVQGCAFLIHQAVCRQVFGVQRDGVLDVLLPFLDGFVGESKHQVNTDVADAGFPQQMYGILNLSGIVSSVQKAKALIRESLGSHADTVDGQLAESMAKRRGDVVGIALHGYFHVSNHAGAIMLADAFENLQELLTGELTGCPSS